MGFASRWWIVAVTVLGLIGGAQALIAAAVGVLVGPITQEFAGSRSGVSAAALLANVSLAAGVLISGALIERWVVGRGHYLPGDEGIGLAVLTFALVFPAIAFAPKEAPASTKWDSAVSTLLGLSLREATQTKSFWLLTTIFLLVPRLQPICHVCDLDRWTRSVVWPRPCRISARSIFCASCRDNRLSRAGDWDGSSRYISRHRLPFVRSSLRGSRVGAEYGAALLAFIAVLCGIRVLVSLRGPDVFAPAQLNQVGSDRKPMGEAALISR